MKSITLRFKLRNTESKNVKDIDTERTISVYANINKERVMYATPLKIKPKYWDNSTGQVIKKDIGYQQAEYVQAAIKKLRADFDGYIFNSTYNLKTPITKESIVKWLNAFFGKQNSNSNEFHAFFEEFLKSVKSRTNSRGQLICKSTQYSYSNLYNKLCEYEKKNNITLTFSDLTSNDFERKFGDFLMTENLATNTIASFFRAINTFLKAAKRERHISEFVPFKQKLEEVDNIALTKEEVELILNYDFSYNPILEQVRDVFIVQCWTGVRFSDLWQLNKKNLNTVKSTFEIRQAKTDSIACIPINPISRTIFEKYDWSLPTFPSVEKFNSYLSEVCKTIGFSDTIQKRTTRGGIKTVTTYAKWERITSHTARRTCATMLYRLGVPSRAIMAITGHKTEEAFNRYLKITQKEYAESVGKKLNEILLNKP